MTHETKSSWNRAVWRRVLGITLLSFLWTDQVFSHSVKWPSGKYGLPMAKSGCPKANGFSWETGYIYQDLEDDKSLTMKSPSFHLNASVFSSGDLRQSFCIKTIKSDAVDNSRFNWPAGQYCIYKKGSTCPTLLLEGWVLWDDENGQSGVNLNFKSGTVPAGTYKKDTEIKFCCQTVGSYGDPIELPIDKPFYLMTFNNKRCQEVLRTIHTVEYIRYDTENDNNHDRQAYPYPFGADRREPYIYYCYYQACRWTMTALNGSFWSPSYPFPYKDKAWCEWHINVPWNYIISLKFIDFRLETIDMCVTQSCDCDYAEVHDNFPNGTSVLIGKYCMGVAYPRGDIKSRNNNITVTFRSDYSVVKAGFKAQYQAIQVIEPTNVGSTTDDKQKVTTPAAITTVNPTTFPFTGATTKGTTTGNKASPSTGNTAATSTSSSSSSSTTSRTTTKTTTATTPPGKSTTKQTTPATTSSGKESSGATTTAVTKQKNTTTFPFTNTSSTTTLITTEKPPSIRPPETTEETSTTRLTTEEHLSPTESSSSEERTDTTAVNGETAQKAKHENTGSGSSHAYVIVAMTASLIALAVVVAATIFCLCRKRQFKRRDKVRNRLSVGFTTGDKIAGVGNVLPNMYGNSDENEGGERYTTVTLNKQEKVNILYDNRPFMDSDGKDDEMDDEIKESDNPLYSSSVEIDQDENRNILYESMDDIIQSVVEAESVNPVYERMV